MNPNLSQALTRCPGCGQDVLLSLPTCPNCGAAADTSSAFLSMKYPAGGGGMIDQKTASFLRSDAPAPSQDTLESLLDRTDRVILKELVFHEQVGTFEPVLEIASREQLALVRAGLRISPSEGHLMSFESHTLECRTGDNCLATLLLVGSFVLRWPGRWKSDAMIDAPDALADCFASCGYRRFREDLDRQRMEAERRSRKHEAWLRSWNAATPPRLASLVEALATLRYAPDASERQRALRVLATTYPSTDEQILALFAWFGHSLGPWSGYPMAEAAPESLLEAFPHDAVVATVQRANLTTNQLEGAARFFCRSFYDRVRKTKVALPPLPADVRQMLWTYVKSTNDDDKIQRAKRVLGATMN